MKTITAKLDLSFYKGKKIFITGHTGFKGSWLSKLLSILGADIMGYALDPPTVPSLYDAAGIDSLFSRKANADIRSLTDLTEAMALFEPEIVIHMAAQPLVRESYNDPVTTYETNVIGTVNVLEAIRHTKSVRSFINVTTDKVYENLEWHRGYRETDRLNGHDPYSNSKSCSELITDSYKRSFLDARRVAASCVRAGNVIGGGDFAAYRIIPDCARAASAGQPIIVRNPDSIRPYQHVLEPVTAYLELAAMQYEDQAYAGCYNIGPDDSGCVTTGDLVSIFCGEWVGAAWENKREQGAPKEAGFLKLDCSKARSVLGWSSKWDIKKAVHETVLWYKAFYGGTNTNDVMEAQILSYISS